VRPIAVRPPVLTDTYALRPLGQTPISHASSTGVGSSSRSQVQAHTASVVARLACDSPSPCVRWYLPLSVSIVSQSLRLVEQTALCLECAVLLRYPPGVRGKL
jgi:hypothetical protein